MAEAEATRAPGPSVVIVGAGFAGLAAARELARVEADITVIDRRNYHPFQPLLYQLATSMLSPADVAWPVRGLLSRRRNPRVIMARGPGSPGRGRRAHPAELRREARRPGRADARPARRRLAAGEACDRLLERGVCIGEDWIAARTILSAAGVRASPTGKWLGVETDDAGQVKVAPDLSVPGLRGVYCVGDTALMTGPDGRPVPGVAPAAKQMGRHVGRLIARRIGGHGDAEEPFRYRDAGALATIGRGKAVAEIFGLKLVGFPAWLVWAVAHVYFLIDARSRLLVAVNWLWDYLTFDRGARWSRTAPPPETARSCSACHCSSARTRRG